MENTAISPASFAQGAGVTGADAGSRNPGGQGAAAPAAAPDAGVGADAAQVDLNAEFESLIKGKYKAQFDTRMQDTIQKRLRGTKETLDRYQALSALVGKRYGVDPADLEAVAQAMEQQTDRVVTPTAENEEMADRLCAAWQQQEQETRAIYPGFDMAGELASPEFVRLLLSNVDVRTAYEVLHRDEIIPAAMAFAARTAEANVARRLASGAARPSENGMDSRAAAVVRHDVSKLTRSDIEAVSRRVARGERVSFG